MTILLLTSFSVAAQSGKNFRIASSHTSFPDTGRANGHRYNNRVYPVKDHYDDSTVLIVVPPGFKAGKKVDIVCWFHGWYNHIDSVLSYFEIAQQFTASGRNAILIIPESAKDAPDSYGGKLEQKGRFNLLLEDVLAKLKKEKIVSKKATAGNIILSGHSGAYRVMAFILQQGGIEINEANLFDGMYGQVDKYINWLQADSSHRFINIYTNKGGGTDNVSAELAQRLNDKSIPVASLEEKDLVPAALRNNRVVFIHSLKEHNDVINRPDDRFRLFLENSPLLQPSRY
ncbi:MAG: hypothetical protein U0T79_04850 [Ferruginibacter sp.]